jgi:signal transduction histidine kinase
VFVLYLVSGSDETLIPAALALVVSASLGMLFIQRSVKAVGAAVGLILLATPAVWGIAPREAIALGTVMAIGFVMTVVVLLAVRNAVTALDNRLKILFDRSPAAVLEEDWSEAIEYVRSEFTGRPDRVRSFLLANPDLVRRAVGLAKVRRANRAAMDLLEVRGPDDLLGYRDGSKVSRRNLESFVDVLVALYLGHGFFEHEFLTRTFRGRDVWLQARCVDDTLGVSLVALADITHLRAEEEALAELIKAKDAFIASISHELRTPLTAVLGLSHEMSSVEMGEPERMELMSLVSGQADEMAYIVEDLLVAARAEIGTVTIEPTTVELELELALALDGVSTTPIEAPTGLPAVYADPMRVRQILRNLLTNLSRYGGEQRRILGGRIGDKAWIEIRDNGPGVPPQDAERIFLPYATAHSGVAGSVGLGLSVARQLASLMGGSLAYLRDSGESVFRLELPVDRASALASASRVGRD